MRIINGDLVKLAKDGYFDVIVHGANCFCTFGSGIAKQIKENFPEAYSADCSTVKGDVDKLGSYSKAIVSINGKELIIVNAYTQFNYGTSSVYADYDAIRLVFKKTSKDFHGKVIAYPAIGAGLAKGDWNTIYDIICTELETEDHVFVKYER